MTHSNRFLSVLFLPLLLFLGSSVLVAGDARPDDNSRPNILWVYLEDTNPWMSSYGDEVVETPNIDALAERGVRFDRAYMPSGVCTPTRSAVITGMYQTTIGAHEHYSSFEVWRDVEMDEWDPNYLSVQTIPEIFKKAGYYTFNEGKFHYNFVYDKTNLYDRNGGNGFKGAKNGHGLVGSSGQSAVFRTDSAPGWEKRERPEKGGSFRGFRASVLPRSSGVPKGDCPPLRYHPENG